MSKGYYYPLCIICNFFLKTIFYINLNKTIYAMDLLMPNHLKIIIN